MEQFFRKITEIATYRTHGIRERVSTEKQTN